MKKTLSSSDDSIRGWIAKVIVIAGCVLLATYGIYTACTHDEEGLRHAVSGVQLLLGVVIGYYFGRQGAGS